MKLSSEYLFLLIAAVNAGIGYAMDSIPSYILSALFFGIFLGLMTARAARISYRKAVASFEDATKDMHSTRDEMQATKKKMVDFLWEVQNENR